jgi:uncharacterized protein (TIGR00297 family)
MENFIHLITALQPVWQNSWAIAILLNTVLLGGSSFALTSLLTPAGIIHAWILGVITWGTLGWRGYVIVVFYFLVGSAVTRVGLAEKEAAGIAEKRSGARGPENVWGSALAGTVCALATLVAPGLYRELLILAYVASFSTKLSDTTASEVGKAFGKRTYLITTLQPVPRGTEGAVSLEGTLAGILASAAIATLAWGIDLISGTGIGVCVLAALVATSLESVLGATLQSRWSWLTNTAVNMINITVGALIGLLVGYALTFTT